ncbi:uncharacterized protein [Engystomops pustulosus]|uniref:uncharacterized protein n=1 Tax=Engystomops pustulosus TaxID=76066 RepID=UPI003AFB7AC0
MINVKKKTSHLRVTVEPLDLAANPERHELLDKKLTTLAKQLADNVAQTEAVLEQMGPLAETYRNQERFQAQRHHGGASNPATETKGKPILQPATFPYQQGDLYKKDKAMKQQPPTAEAPQVPAACNQQKDHSRPSDVTRAEQTPHVPAFSVQRGYLPDASSGEQAPQVPVDGSLQQDCAPDPEARGLQCYFCYEATQVQNCNLIRDCPADAKGCKTMTLSPNTGYPFISGDELVTRDCASSCFQSDPNSLGAQHSVYCCQENLCNNLYEVFSNLTSGDSPSIMRSGVYRGLLPSLATLCLRLFM